MRTARVNEKALPFIGVGLLMLLAVGVIFNASYSEEAARDDDRPDALTKFVHEDEEMKPVAPAYQCTAGEKQKQNQRFAKRNSEAWAHTACPDEGWLFGLQKAFKNMGRQKLEIYDIGCNKGYTSANFLASFAPEYNVNPSNVYQNIEKFARDKKIAIDKACGVCGDCYEKIKSDDTLGKDPFTVDVHCFEPSPASFKILDFISEQLGVPTKNSRHTWHLHNMGMYNESGTLSWHPSCSDAGGGELCAIVAKGTKNAVDVPVVTVDDFARKRKKRPDLLKIDAEGFDPAVLAGAEETLSSGETPLVLFEYNPDLKSGGLWHNIKLAPVIKWFDDLGYDCFYESDDHVNADPAVTPLMYRITGDCLSTNPPGFRGWSNILCALRSDTEVLQLLTDRTMI